MEPADILIHDGTIVTMDPARRVLRNHSIAVRSGRIVAIGPAEDMRREYAGAAKVLNARRKAVLPGLIDLHGHAGTSLLKGIGDDLPGGPWRDLMDFVAGRTS